MLYLILVLTGFILGYYFLEIRPWKKITKIKPEKYDFCLVKTDHRILKEVYQYNGNEFKTFSHDNSAISSITKWRYLENSDIISKFINWMVK